MKVLWLVALGGEKVEYLQPSPPGADVAGIVWNPENPHAFFAAYYHAVVDAGYGPEYAAGMATVGYALVRLALMSGRTLAFRLI